MKSLICTAIVLCATVLSSKAQTENEYIKDATASCVTLIMEDEFGIASVAGTGFIVSEGVVATSIHVVEGYKFGHAIQPSAEGQHKIEGYFGIDTNNHMILLSAPTLTGEGLKLSFYDAPEIGKKIYAIGTKRGVSNGVHKGIITGTRKLSDRRLYQVSAPISRASNGGPILDEKGEVLAMAMSALYQGNQINFAIPVEFLRELKSRNYEGINYLPVPKGVSKPYLPKSEQKYILKGLEVLNREFENNHESKKNLRLGQNLLKRFSIRNDYPAKVMNVHVNFVLRGADGVIIDSYEKTFLEGYPDDVLDPNETSAIELYPFDWEKARALRLEEGEVLEIRIIDFDFVED